MWTPGLNLLPKITALSQTNNLKFCHAERAIPLRIAGTNDESKHLYPQDDDANVPVKVFLLENRNKLSDS
jgi:hypothetical protein